MPLSLKTLNKKPESWISVHHAAGDGYYAVTLVPAIGKGKPRILKSSYCPSAETSFASLAGLLKTAEAIGSKSNLVLSKNEYVIHVVPEPPVDDEEFEQTLKWSSVNLFDFSIDECHVSWLKIPTVVHLPNRPPHLYLIVERPGVLASYTEGLKREKVTLESVIIRETAQKAIVSLVVGSGEGVALLVAGPHGIQLTISMDGHLYLDRYIEEPLLQVGTNDEVLVQRSLERIVVQVQRSLDFMARTLPFVEVTKLYLAPAMGQSALLQYLSENVSIPVIQFDFADIIDFSECPELQSVELQARFFYAMSGAIDAMNGNSSQRLNLLENKKGKSGKRIELVAMMILILSIVIHQSIAFIRNDHALEAINRQNLVTSNSLMEANNQLTTLTQRASDGGNLDSEINALKTDAEEAARLISSTEDLGSSRGLMHLFDRFSQISETDIWITGVNVSKSGKALSVSGNALHKESIIRYIQSLNTAFSSDGIQFNSVEIVPVTSSSKNPVEAISFKIF